MSEQPQTCLVSLIITGVQGTGGADTRYAPLVGEWYTIHSASLCTGQTRANIRQLLHRYADQFDCARYQATAIKGRLARRYARRLLTRRDIETIRSFYPIIVKYKAPCDSPCDKQWPVT